MGHPINAARYVRYMQWGAFSAVFRPHDGGNADTRIWTFKGEVYTILRGLLRLRGSITPWVYALAARTRDHAWPFCRPMWWDYGQEAAAAGEDAYEMTSQYMFGDVLVRPISQFISPANSSPPFSANETAVLFANYSVWVPGGCWMAWDGISFKACGPVRLERSAPLAEIPLFVRVGTVIPMWPPGRRSVAVARRPRVWALWVDDSVTALHGADYEDDGESLDRNSSVTHLNALLNRSALEINITARMGVYNGMPAEKTHVLQIRGGPVDLHLPSTVCCVGLRPCQALKAGIVGDFLTPGYWTVTQDRGEMAVPKGALIVVCPAVKSAESLSVTIMKSGVII